MNKMKNKTLMAVLVLATLITAACGGGQTPPTPRLTEPPPPTNPPAQPSAAGTDNVTGTSWILTTLNGQPALKGTTVTLNFVAGKVAGSDGCNNYNGSYTADGTNIKF